MGMKQRSYFGNRKTKEEPLRFLFYSLVCFCLSPSRCCFLNESLTPCMPSPRMYGFYCTLLSFYMTGLIAHSEDLTNQTSSLSAINKMRDRTQYIHLNTTVVLHLTCTIVFHTFSSESRPESSIHNLNRGFLFHTMI